MRPITGITILGFRLGVIALAIYWGALFLGTHWPSGTQIVRQVGDKTMHFSGFFGLSILCCYVSNSSAGARHSSVKRFSCVFIALLAYAIFDELTQSFSPGRHPDLYDVLADAGGILSAIVVYGVAKYGAAKYGVTKDSVGETETSIASTSADT